MSESLYKLSAIRLTLYDAIIPNCSNYRDVTYGSFGEAWLSFKNISTGASSRGVSYSLRSVALYHIYVYR
jgi:hypothetical protein